MRKKLLSTLLATAMAVTMLAGCGSNGGQQATTPATDNNLQKQRQMLPLLPQQVAVRLA